MDERTYNSGYAIGFSNGHSEGYLKGQLYTEREVLKALKLAVGFGQTLPEFIAMLEKRVNELSDSLPAATEASEQPR